MKTLITAFVILIAYNVSVFAQSDTMVIKLKNNQIEKIAISKIRSIKFENVTSVNEPTQNSSGLSVMGNFPNPFQEKTNIEFEIATAGNVDILIYDNTGNQIQKLECNNCQNGKNSLPWNCVDINNKRVESGVYYYEVRFNSEVLTKKMILVK